MSIAKVEPLTSARALRGPFDYRLPERLRDVGVGTVLLVPFGRRRVLGVVVDLAERSALPPERLAAPIEALEAGAAPELIGLGLWVARE
jgi:primosomal protein N' (replication factor Y) (superfamily II helicase)